MPGFATALALILSEAALPVQAAEAATHAPAEHDVMETQTDADERMTVPVSIEGQGPFSFLIDTGSQRTVVSDRLAGQLALESGPIVRIVSVAGVELVQTAQVGELTFGRNVFYPLAVPLLKDQNIGAHGILGTDSLQDRRLMIDFEGERILVGDRHELGGDRGYEIVVRAQQQAGQLIMTHADIDGIRTSVIIDTGAGISVGNRALQRALERRKRGTKQVLLKSVTGHSLTADLGFADKLQLRDVRISNLVIAYADTPAFDALDLIERPALFLGMRELRLFKRVAIDFRSKRVLFDLPPQDSRDPFTFVPRL